MFITERCCHRRGDIYFLDEGKCSPSPNEGLGLQEIIMKEFLVALSSKRSSFMTPTLSRFL